VASGEHAICRVVAGPTAAGTTSAVLMGSDGCCGRDSTVLRFGCCSMHVERRVRVVDVDRMGLVMSVERAKESDQLICHCPLNKMPWFGFKNSQRI
jgi:hypothetical protein